MNCRKQSVGFVVRLTLDVLLQHRRPEKVRVYRTRIASFFRFGLSVSDRCDVQQGVVLLVARLLTHSRLQWRRAQIADSLVFVAC